MKMNIYTAEGGTMAVPGHFAMAVPGHFAMAVPGHFVRNLQGCKYKAMDEITQRIHKFIADELHQHIHGAAKEPITYQTC